MTEPALRFREVTRIFRTGAGTVRALDRVNIEVRPGRITGLIGPDGAGKTTLMRLAVGLLAPDGGEVEVLGIDAGGDPQTIQSTVGYMPQRFGLYEDLTVQENLDLYADLQGIPMRERPARYARLTRMTGLAPFTARLAGRLSGGMKQKLGLACALLREPPLLVLDEPTVGVDPVSRRELWAIVQEQVRDQGMTVLLSTAYLDEAERCDDVILLDRGQVLGQRPPDAFAREVAGRVFVLRGLSLPPRRIQTRLQGAAGVVDALVVGDHVRLVTEPERRPELPTLFPDQPSVALEPVAPRFEDAFIALLRARTGNREEPPDPGLMQPSPPEGTRTDEAVIEVQDLRRRFGDFEAVRGVSFRVRRGEIFGLLGANGAGKTTTFRMLCGLLPPSAGTARVAGHDLRHAAARARSRIGYMAQRFSLYASLTVLQNLRFFSSAYGLRGGIQRERIRWALESFGLEPYRGMNAALLPLGFKQRLAFAAALMHRPEILFLDEPTSGVDPLARREFWLRVNHLAEQGVTVLVTTHFMEEANYCDRLVIMAEGRVLAEDTPHALRARFRTPANPEPTLEDAFIGLIEQAEAAA